jgi:FlaA1/EpsC-like NDP-sugar epimerase
MNDQKKNDQRQTIIHTCTCRYWRCKFTSSDYTFITYIYMYDCLSIVIFLLAITLSVLFWFTSSDYTFSTYMYMYDCLSIVIFLLAITLSVLFRFTSSDYTFSTYMYVWLFVYSHFSLGHYIVCSLLVIRRCKSKENRQCNGQKKNDYRQTIIHVHVGTEGVIRRCKSKEDRQCNDLKKNDYRQTIIHTCRYWRCNQKM